MTQRGDGEQTQASFPADATELGASSQANNY